MINSKKKGKVGELELVNYLKKYGLEARRSQQYAGINGDADVVCKELSNFHIEVKRNETLNIEKALVQSETDSKNEEIPIVAHRKNREEWKITLRLSDFLKILGYESS